MRRCFKKVIAFGLALAMFASCVVVSAEETDGHGIAVIEEAVYDEAASFLDSIVLLENGHWAKMVEDEATGERKPYTDVTAETNIVFIDGEGNKKVISNKDANGEMIFDAVHPEITNLDSNDYIRVLKGDKEAYISPDGEFFGDTLKFYEAIDYISDDYLLVTEDGINCNLINKSGEVVYSFGKVDNVSLINNYFYVSDNNKVVIIRENDMSIVKEYSGVSGFHQINDKYIQIWTDDRKVILNSETEEVLENYVVTYCYNAKFSPDYLIVETKTESGNDKYELVNMVTEEAIASFQSYPEYFEDGYFYDREGKIFVSTDGAINVDLNGFIEKISVDSGELDYNPLIYYIEGVVYGIVSSSDDNDVVTYILKEDDNFDISKMEKLNGYLEYINREKGCYLLTNNRGKLWGLYSLEGSLIKDFTDTDYYTDGDDIPLMSNILTTVYTNGDNKSNALLTSTGEIIGDYETFKIRGAFYVGGTKEGKLEVVNGNGEVVYSGEGEYNAEGGWIAKLRALNPAYSFVHKNWFAVIKDDVCSLYDYNGNKIELGDTYSAVGPCEGISGSYRIGDDEAYGYYCYSNDDFANGLCVTRKTDADGNYKYGVIKLNVVLEKGDCNGDKLINAQDALAVLKHAAKISILPDETVGEVTGDGLLNAQDALKILQFAAHIIDSLE